MFSSAVTKNPVFFSQLLVHFLLSGIMAVKVLRIPSENKREIVEDLQREIDLMKSLKHPNIVRYLGAEVDNSKNTLNIFQEWAPGGSISALLKKFGTFSINVVKSYVIQILKGLDYLHSHGIIHRDIKVGHESILPQLMNNCPSDNDVVSIIFRLGGKHPSDQ
jgi:serine/threonine protein kinase